MLSFEAPICYNPDMEKGHHFGTEDPQAAPGRRSGKLWDHAPYILASAGSLLLLALIFNNNLWMDEAFTAGIVRCGFSEMLARSFGDTLPPLYNIAAWCMTRLFGYSSVILKLTSVLPMIALMFFSASCLTKSHGSRVSCLYILSLLCAPHIVHFSVEIRMYSMALSFASFAAWFALSLSSVPKRSHWAGLSLFTVLSGFAHHYGIFASAFLWLMLLIHFLAKDRRQLKAFAFYAGLTALLYLPCLILAINQLRRASSYFSAAGGTLSSLLSDLRYPFVTNVTAVSAMLLLLFGLAFLSGLRKPVSFQPLFLMASPFAMLLFSYLIMAMTGSSFFSARYLVPGLGILWLGFSILSDKSPASKVLFPLSLTLLLISGCITYTGQLKEEYGTDPSRMTEYFHRHFSPEDGYLVLDGDHQIEVCLHDYYLPDIPLCPASKVGEISGNFWCMAMEDQSDSLSELRLQGIHAEYVDEFSFDQYRFRLYLLTKSDGLKPPPE